MAKFIALFLVLISIPLVSAICTEPFGGMEIRESLAFCPGVYDIENGINAADDNIAIDCNNSVLRGTGLGYGILIKNKNNIEIRNCNISGYEIGIYLENASKNVIENNYLENNKFGIALFNSFDNQIENNIFLGNIQNIIASTSETTPEFITEAEKLDSTQKVLEQVIRIKKPFLGENEVLSEVELIFNKYFNLTQENLEIRRTLQYNESDKATTIRIQLIPKKVLMNLSVYESIPKCVSGYINQILFETGGYEVINNDPLILWSFARLDSSRELSYKVFRNIDEECRQLLSVFGIATGFEDFKAEEEKAKKQVNYFYIFLFAVIIMILLYFIFRKVNKNN